MGTYYIRLTMGEVGLQVNDEGVNFDWDVWGPDQESQVMNLALFSIR